MALDHPEVTPMGSSVWTYATTKEEYGRAEQEIINVSGIEFYNLKIEYSMGGSQPFVIYGVLNDEGTKLYKQGNSKSLNEAILKRNSFLHHIF